MFEAAVDDLHSRLPVSGLGFAIGSDHPLIDHPGGFDLEVPIADEQGFQPGLLPGDEQIRAGVQGAAGP